MQDSEPLTLEHALRIARRRVTLVAVCCIVVAGAAYAFSKQQTKMYTASASVLFQNNPLSQQLAGLPANTGNLLVQQAGDVELVALGDMAAKTARRLGGGLTEDAVRRSLTIGGLGESSAVGVSSTAHSPALAARIANTYVDEFVAEQQRSNRRFYRSALTVVEKQLAALPLQQRFGPTAVALQGRAQTLRFLSELKYGNVKVAQAAVPPASPSSPNTSFNTILGGLLGLILGLGLAFLLERRDRDSLITDPRDLEEIYRTPLLGVVPDSAALARSPGRAGPHAISPAEAEAFHLIRAHLRSFNADRDPRTVLVASPQAGDGRTTVARNLAEAAARLGARALLVEADLRHPTLAETLGIQLGADLPGVLSGVASMEEATWSIYLDPLVGETTTGRTMDVLACGALGAPHNPGELMESYIMDAVLEQARSAYDFIVIDTPPLADSSDAFSLLAKVDGVVVIGRIRCSRRDVADQLCEVLRRSSATILGAIANRTSLQGFGRPGYVVGHDRLETAPSPATAAMNGAAAHETFVSTTSMS